MHIARLGLLAVALIVATARCDSGTSSGTPTVPSVTPPTTENFSGTVPVGGSDANPFVVKLSGGLLTVSLTAAGPPSTITMGIGIGSWSDPVCAVLPGDSTSAAAGPNPQLSGVISAGSYCLSVFDTNSGAQTAPVSYTAIVTHY